MSDDIKIIKPGKPLDDEIKWTCWEEPYGPAVQKLVEAKGADSLQVGDEVLVETMFGPALAKVTKLGEDPMAENESSVFTLSYEEGVWRCNTAISKQAMAQLKFAEEETPDE